MYDSKNEGKEFPIRRLAVWLAVGLMLCAVNFQALPILAAADNSTLSATVAKNDGTSPVELVLDDGSETATAVDWAYNETRTLTISADFTDVTGERSLTIELPVGMVFNSGGYPTEADSQISRYEYTASDLPPGYSAPATGGTLTYTISPNVNQVALKILISYDEQLWNKQNGGSVTGSPDNKESTHYQIPVKVTKNAGEDVQTKILSEVVTYQGSDKTKRYYVAYNKDPELIYDKPLNKEVSVGRHYIYNGRESQINSTPNLYWKKITLIQEAPYKTLESGEIVYATIVEKGSVIAPTAYSSVQYDDASHTITVTWDNYGNFSYGAPSINAKFIFPKDKGFAGGDEITYPQPLIYAQGIYGEERIYNQPDPVNVVRFQLADKEKLTLGEVGMKKFPVSETNTDVVYYLSGFQLSNQGGVDSGQQTFTYTFAGTSGVGVTTMRLIMPKKDDCTLNTDKKVVVTCTALDADGEPVPDYVETILIDPTTDSTGSRTILSRSQDMVEKNYYFHTVSYTVDRLTAGTIYYSGSSPFTSGGSVYGKLTGSAVSKPEAGRPCLTAALKIEAVTSDGSVIESSLMKILASDEQSTTTIGFRNDPLKNKEKTIAAGGTLTVDAQLEVSNYPYHSTTFLSHPVFYLRLPDELTLVENSLKTDRAGVVPVKQSSAPEMKNGEKTGYTLTPITFGNTLVPVGYYGENLESVKGQTSLTLTFTLQASNEISQIKEYDLRDLVCAGDQKVSLSDNNSGWNPHNWTHNPSAADNYSAGVYRATYSHNKTTNATFTVQAAAPTVEFLAVVKDHENTTDADYTNAMALIGNTGFLDYRISFSNKLGGTVDGEKFFYLIQLPKEGTAMSNHLTGGMAFSPTFHFALTGPVALKSEFQDLYDIRYSVDSDPLNGDFYNNGKADFDTGGGNFAAYHPKEDFAEGSGLNWKDVRCIKLVVKETNGPDRAIPNGESCAITLENVEWDVGNTTGNTDFQWSACGLQRYDLGDLASEGHTPTNPVTFHIHPFQIDSSATLTGVKGDSTWGTTKIATVSIPAYLQSKTLKVQSVTVGGGIRLVSIDTLNMNRMAGEQPDGFLWGDQNFSLTASLNAAASVDILNGAEGSVVGSTKEKEVSTLTITLDHADLISTRSTAGTVTVVIGEDAENGVKITETIAIRTIGTEMDAGYPSSSLWQGKNFTGTGPEGEQVKITSDSAVSILFRLQSYLHASYGEPYLEGTLPTGSALILADLSDKRRPNYYYYFCESDLSATSLPLTAFTSMTDGTTSFDYTKLPVDAKLLFVLDYAQAAQDVSGETAQTLKLVFPEKEGGAAAGRTGESSWKIAPKREFTIGIDNTGGTISMTSKGKATLSGSLDVKQLLGNDTYHGSDYLTLSLTLYDKSGKAVNFPAGAAITAKTTNTAATDKTGTAENKALLSLGEVKDDSVAFTILLETAGWGLEPDTYTLRAELYCSRAEGYISAVAPKPEAEKVIPLTVTAEPAYGLMIQQTGGGSRLARPDSELSFELDYEVPVGEIPKFSAELYEKTAGIYSETATAWTAQPVFTENSNGTCAAVVHVPSSVKEGQTYRILFRMKSGGKVTEVPYNIIVRE